MKIDPEMQEFYDFIINKSTTVPELVYLSIANLVYILLCRFIPAVIVPFILMQAVNIVALHSIVSHYYKMRDIWTGPIDDTVPMETYIDNGRGKLILYIDKRPKRFKWAAVAYVLLSMTISICILQL